MDEEVVNIHRNIIQPLKREETLPLAKTELDLKNIMLSEVKLDEERQILYNFTYM